MKLHKGDLAKYVGIIPYILSNDQKVYSQDEFTAISDVIVQEDNFVKIACIDQLHEEALKENEELNKQKIKEVVEDKVVDKVVDKKVEVKKPVK